VVHLHHTLRNYGNGHLDFRHCLAALGWDEAWVLNSDMSRDRRISNIKSIYRLYSRLIHCWIFKIGSDLLVLKFPYYHDS